MLNRTLSRITFVVLTALLVGGFPNFMAQEAYAAETVNIQTGGTQTTATDAVRICFDVNDVDDEVDLRDFTNWSIDVSGGTSYVTLTAGTLIFTQTDASCTTISSITITGMTVSGGTVPFATSATPRMQLADIGLEHGGGNTLNAAISQDLTDGIAPTVASAATTSSTTIVLTMTEAMTNSAAVASDFSVGGIASNPTVSGLAVSGTSITLTLSTSIVSTDNPTVTFVLGTANDIEDAANNDLASFSNQAVTNNIAAPATGGGCSDCEAPTLGLNSESRRIVEGGFTYNGRSVDAERFFTPYPLITVQVGKQNTAVFKIYEDKGPENVKHFAFAFGLEKSDIISNSKAMIELDIDHEGTETVTVTDPENALDNIKVSTNIENCNGDDSTIQCLIVTIDHRFRAPLVFNIVATDVWDMQRNSWQNYFNHGIEVTGESLNPAKEYDGIKAGHIYHLTETSKITALDEFGGTWSFQYGKWEMDFVKNERIQDTSSVFNRMHSDFAEYKVTQADNAIAQLLEYCPTCLESFTDFDDSFGHEYSNELNALDDPEMIQKMLLENERAQKIMNYLLDPSLRYR